MKVPMRQELQLGAALPPPGEAPPPGAAPALGTVAPPVAWLMALVRAGNPEFGE